MKDWIYLVAGVLLAVVAGGATARMAEPRGATARGAARTDELSGALARMGTTLAAMEQRQVELERSLDELTSALPAGDSSRREVGGLDAAVARWMSAHGTANESDEPAAAPVDDGIDEVVARLLADPSGGDQDLWQELRDSGRIDEVIAELAEIVATDPYDPDLHFELGYAYLQKTFGLPPGPTSIEVAEKADETFDRALELDDAHWPARFAKALTLSNQPAFLGKTPEAIHQYEILLAQQEAQPQEAHFAQTYHFLGNLYQQTGESAKALETWRRGLELFPDNADLANQLEIHRRAESRP
jgi:tetratricopeptide (TPR) repeat protein